MSELCNTFDPPCDDFVKTLSIEKGSAATENCEDVFETTGSLMEQCKTFCGGAGAVPVLVGSSTFGLSLEDAADICLDPEIIERVSDEQMTFCQTTGPQSIHDMESGIIQFVQTHREFVYAILRFQTNLNQKVKDVATKISDANVISTMKDLSRDKWPEYLRLIYSAELDEIITKKGPVSELVDAKRIALKEAAAALEALFREKLEVFQKYTEECNMYFPKMPNFLKDVCKDVGPKCIEDEAAEHVGCCCYVNAVAFGAVGSTSRRLTEELSTGLSTGRRLQTGNAIDVCSEAYKRSEPFVQQQRDVLIANGDQSLLDEIENRFRSRRLLEEPFSGGLDVRLSGGRLLREQRSAGAHQSPRDASSRQLEVCGGESMDTLCDAFETFQCSSADKELLIESPLDTPFCEDISDYNTLPKIMDACSDFCGDASSIPVTVGSDSFGFSLEQATGVCLSPELLGGGGYSSEAERKCDNKGTDALAAMTAATTAFVETHRVFRYAHLLFQGEINHASESVATELESPAFQDLFRGTVRDKKVGVIQDVYRAALAGGSSGALGVKLGSQIDKLKGAAAALATVMEAQLDKLETFMDECNRFFPKSPTFLKDLCRDDGPSCIDNEQGEHVACCCLKNPVAGLIVPDAPASIMPMSPPPPSPEPERRLAEALTSTFNRRLQSDGHHNTIDVCYSAFKNSKAEVDALVDDIEAIGQGQIVQDYRNTLKDKYGKNSFESQDSLKKPCFPSSATVLKASGEVARVDALKEGDAVLAATADGALTIDTISLFSLSDAAANAAFVSLATDANTSITLTADHHLPVGAVCCSRLARAKDVAIGDTVWAIAGDTAVASRVVAKELKIEKGLHSPVLTNGGFPVIDGVVTSFDRIEMVALSSYLAFLLPLCKATGSCSLMRRAIVAAECGLSQVFGASDSSLVCAGRTYIDGLEIIIAPKSAVAASHVEAIATASCEMGK